jgi:hypothetical protein
MTQILQKSITNEKASTNTRNNPLVSHDLLNRILRKPINVNNFEKKSFFFHGSVLYLYYQNKIKKFNEQNHHTIRSCFQEQSR